MPFGSIPLLRCDCRSSDALFPSLQLRAAGRGAVRPSAPIGGDGVLEPFEYLRLLGFSEPYFGVFRQPLTGGFKRYERRFLPITSALRKAEI